MPPATPGKHAEAASAFGVLRFACPACGKHLRTRKKPTPKLVACPCCGQTLTIPGAEPQTAPPTPVRPIPLYAILVLVLVVAGCAVYANLAFGVKNAANLRYFPPFLPHVNGNGNWGLGGEYFNIAKAVAAGQGFTNPFGDRTGPTAWQPPLLPAFLAGLLWLSDGNRAVVVTVVVCLDVLVLIGTGLLVLALARQTTSRLGIGLALLIFLLALLCQFNQCFQRAHDVWLVLLCLDLLLAGLCWLRPLHGNRPAGRSLLVAAGWGVFGGLCAQVSPVPGFSWGLLSVLVGLRQRTWSRLAVALLAAGLTLAPWTVRNYLVLGRLVPMKSNLAFEAYQSQCLQPDGLLQNFKGHPGGAGGPEGREYRRVGEIAYLERKRAQFWQAVRADPAEFLDRAASRVLAATLWYVPFNRVTEAKQPLLLWLGRLTHPLPFLALLILLFTAPSKPLQGTQWLAIGLYVFQLLPYVLVSYYDRYAAPLLAVKALLIIWAADRLLTWGKAGNAPGSLATTRGMRKG
jgi:hypothetical protein